MTLRARLASSLALASSLSVLFASASASAQSHVTCVGDSITAGTGTSSPPATAYPAVLQTLLGAAFAVENDGQSGATMMVSGDTPYTQVIQYDRSTAWAAAGGDVVIQLGTNDSKAPNWAHKAAFLDDCKALVRHYQQAPGSPRVWLNLVPPASATACCDIDSAVIASQIVPLLQACASETGAVTIDVFGAFGANMGSLTDGVHPDDGGAALLAKTVYDSLSRTPKVSLAATHDAGSAVTLTATPAAAYGKTERVVFFDGATVVREVTSSPWSFTLAEVTDGPHVFHAEMIETAGRKADSPGVTVVVTDGVPVSTPSTPQTGETPNGAGPAFTPASSPKSSSGCAVRSSGHLETTMPGALAFGLLALAGLRRSRRR